MRDVGPPTSAGGEKETLVATLDYLRDAILRKIDGVPEPQIRAPQVPSGTNLLGLVKHLGHVERFYFLGEPIVNLPRTLRPTRRDTVEGLVADYREAVARADEVVAGYDSLDEPAPRAAGRTSSPTMRWVLVHMIEETARHAGHADILREQLDASTGR